MPLRGCVSRHLFPDVWRRGLFVGRGVHCPSRSGFRVQESGIRVQGSGFGVQGSGFGVQGSGIRAATSLPDVWF